MERTKGTMSSYYKFSEKTLVKFAFIQTSSSKHGYRIAEHEPGGEITTDHAGL